MATYQELRARSQQVRDEQNIGGNTALRVGQLLMDIVKYFYDNDAAASEYLQQHFAMVNDGTQLLNWQQSPIVILHTMGETYDEGDFSSLSQGENYYRAGFIMEANGQGGGINGETPKANVLYVNLANDTLYTWNGASFDAITSGGGGSISGDDIIKNAYYSNGNLVLIVETESGDKTVSIPVNFDASNYVPTSRTVNGKALSNNITLSQSDIPGLVAALAALVPQTRTINGKALSSNVTIGMNDIQGLVEAIANAGSGAVSVTTNQDGTFVIHVGSTDYTINLNHTHEGMAKLVVDTAANLPDASEMESDTIYGELDDGEIATIYLGGYPFYGGGASSGPVLRRPADGATIDMGQTTSGTVSKTINVKGKSLTQALTIELDGTGYTFGTTQPSGVTRDSATQLTVTAAAANVLNGVDIVVVYTGNDTDENASGTLGITSASPDSISTEATLVANKVTYEDLAGVKLTGTQWLQTDYYPNPNTEWELECKLTANTRTNSTSGDGTSILRCNFDTSSTNERFYLHTSSGGTNYFAYSIFYQNKSGTGGQKEIEMRSISTAEMVADHAIISYVKGASAGTFTFNGGTARSVSTFLQTETLTSPMAIGYHQGNQTKFNVFDLTIYELTITENGQTVRHWVPKLKEGTTAGLYDTITNKFISSETADELVAIPLT